MVLRFTNITVTAMVLLLVLYIYMVQLYISC